MDFCPPAGDSLFYSSNNYTLTPAQSLAKEVIELLKICPKATMNFSKFVPAYHNYFGKQCRVADYGYTKLIELFEGMSSIIQVRKIEDKKAFWRVIGAFTGW